MFSELIKKLSNMVLTREGKGDEEGDSRKRKDASLEKKPKAKFEKKVKESSSKPAYQLEDEDIGENSLEKEENTSAFPVEVEVHGNDEQPKQTGNKVVEKEP